MAKSQSERDAAYRKKQSEQDMFYIGLWIHKSIIPKIRETVARENKKAIKINSAEWKEKV